MGSSLGDTLISATPLPMRNNLRQAGGFATPSSERVCFYTRAILGFIGFMPMQRGISPDNSRGTASRKPKRGVAFTAKPPAALDSDGQEVLLLMLCV